MNMCILQLLLSVYVCETLDQSSEKIYLPSSALNFPCDQSHLVQKMSVYV